MEGGSCGDVLVVTSPKEDAMVVVLPELDGEKLADEFAWKPVELAPTVEFVEVLVEFEDDVNTGCAGRLSALMISAAFDWLLAMSHMSEGRVLLPSLPLHKQLLVDARLV